MKTKRTNQASFNRACLFATVLTALFFLADARAASGLQIRIAAECSVTNERIVIGDIAEITGDPLSADRVRNISLGYAPAVGASRQITRERIVMAISAAGFGQGEVDLIAPQIVSVTRVSQTVTREEIVADVERTVLDPMRANGVEVVLTRLDFPQNLAVPTGQVEVRVSTTGVSNMFAPFSISAEISVDGKVFRRVTMNAGIEATAEIYVAAREISLNSKIDAESLKVERRRISKPLMSYVKPGDPLKGLISVRNLKAGDEIPTDSIVSGIVVRSGDPVRIIGRSGSLQLTVNGVAKASGRIGERIPVANAESKQILQAVVADEGIVRVSF